uniref:Dynein heavy chain linker domain-containing protein n=1 Tax=Oryzias latipes TaxID=8090 RepID=A0A3P9JWU7_ORYLA
NFLKHFVESRPDDYSMPQDWMDNILARVPAELTEAPKQKEHTEELCNLVRDDFKKVLVQFTGNVSYLLCVNAGRYKFSQPRFDSFLKTRSWIEKKLYIVEPVMQAILEIGITTLSSLVLVNLPEYRVLGPMDCKSLQNKLVLECKRKEDSVMNTWFPQILKLFNNEKIPESTGDQKQASFYNCASTLISNQLRSVLHKGIEEFVSVFDPSRQHCLPIFQMALTFDDEKMEMYPTPRDVEKSVLEILNKVQTVQSWLGHASPSFVNAKVTGDYFLWAHSTVKSAVLKNMEGPGKHFQSYVDSYSWLVNGTAQTQVDTFLKEEHSFEEYTKKVETFHNLAKEISSLPPKVYFTMVQLDCEELKQGLANKAKAYADLLLDKLVIRQICSEFEAIKQKVLDIPKNTEEIAQMEKYIDFTKKNIVPELNNEVKVKYLTYFSFISHKNMSEDIKLNSTVYLWPHNILLAFEQSEEVNSRQKEEKELIARRERLTVQLEKLEHNIKTFPLYSELGLIQEYIADVRTTGKRLQEAEENIVGINKEEAFYKWEITCYPEVKAMKEQMEPYQKVFECILKWQHTESRWMDGSFLDLNGETMETQVDEFYREIYKMLKFFQQKQSKAAQEVAKTYGKAEGQPDEKSSSKQECPTVNLCSIVIEQIQKFKVFYLVK